MLAELFLKVMCSIRASTAAIVAFANVKVIFRGVVVLHAVVMVPISLPW